MGAIDTLNARIAENKPMGVKALLELRKELELAITRGHTDLNFWRKEITDRAHSLRAKVATELHATADLIVRNMGLKSIQARDLLPTIESSSVRTIHEE